MKITWLIATIGIFTLMIIVGGSYLLLTRGTMSNNKQHMGSMMNGGNTTTNQNMMEGMGHGASVDLKSTEDDYGHEFLPPLPFYLPSNAMFGTTQ
ncbi:hypothetical protein [Exiguobacterium sp. s154]|uniref:hypothetical protein n=1 Tax=Exiguobacterium sp. s154 TaxID=2751277 RepID=UPI001BED13E7|nr:hypothetical protein [Exiguobacterium sp. s154]